MELQKLIDGLKAHKSGAASYESVDEAIRIFEAMRDVDGEKVVKGLDCFVNHVNGPYLDDCRKAECEYLKAGDCEMMVMSDALALIRKQQERIAELEAANASWQTFAPFLHAHGLLNEMEGV